MIPADTVAEVIAHCWRNTPDLILFDIDAVDKEASAVVHQLSYSAKCPVFILSSNDREQDIVRVLESGADDYIVKPFRTGELVARARVALRRRTEGAEESTLTLGSFTVDLTTKRVRKDDVEVHLTPTEYTLLLLFMRNAGKVLTHRYILETIWGTARSHETDYLRVFVGLLRKKLADDPVHPRYIMTATSIGYGWAFESPSSVHRYHAPPLNASERAQ